MGGEGEIQPLSLTAAVPFYDITCYLQCVHSPPYPICVLGGGREDGRGAHCTHNVLDYVSCQYVIPITTCYVPFVCIIFFP